MVCHVQIIKVKKNWGKTSLDILSLCSRQPLTCPSIIPSSWCSPSCLISALLNMGPLSDSLPTNRIWQKWWDDTSETELQTDCGFCLHRSLEHPSHPPTPLSLSVSLSLSLITRCCVQRKPRGLWRGPRDVKPCEWVDVEADLLMLPQPHEQAWKRFSGPSWILTWLQLSQHLDWNLSQRHSVKLHLDSWPTKKRDYTCLLV